MRGRILFLVAAGVAVVAACTSTSSTGTSSTQSADSTNACSVASDCTLVADQCCGAANTAVNKDAAVDFEKKACPRPPPCPGPASGGATRNAVCRSGTCAVLDLASDPISACKTDDDCVLRCGDCRPCQATAIGAIVAVAKSGEPQYLADICASGCSTCAAPPTPNTSVRAKCKQSTGHCQAAALLPDGGDVPY